MINQSVNKNYRVNVIDPVTNCSISDTITIPGYDNLFASFLINTTDCISLLDAEIQCLNNSIINAEEISNLSYWDMGDGTIIPFNTGINPTYIYKDTGNFIINLTLINNGSCTDSFTNNVCVISDNKLYAPNIFTPDKDNCNDEFYITGLGSFQNFNLKIYNRWGGGKIFESQEIILTNTLNDYNNCNDNNPYIEYYKMGSWDGTVEGKNADLGTYVFVATYNIPNKKEQQILKGYIILIR